MRTVVISPFNVLNFPEGGGHFWVYMQYVQGLQQSGCDVFWLEEFRNAGDPQANAARLRSFRTRMESFGLGDKLILYQSPDSGAATRLPDGYLGMDRAEAEAIFNRAELLLNFHYSISPQLL